MPWETEFPGIRMRMPFNDPAGGVCTVPMLLEPGAEAPLHERAAVERTRVLEGRFLDEGGCGPGRFLWRPPGDMRAAWAGPEGVTIPGVFLEPGVFADAQGFFSQDRGGGAG